MVGQQFIALLLKQLLLLDAMSTHLVARLAHSRQTGRDVVFTGEAQRVAAGKCPERLKSISHLTRFADTDEDELHSASKLLLHLLRREVG